MDRLFVGIYVRLVLSLVAAAVVFRLVVVPRIERRAAVGVHAAYATALDLARDRLGAAHARGGDVRAEHARLAPGFAIPTALVARSALRLGDGDAARLDRGEVVPSGEPPHAVLLGRVAGTDRVLVVGPLDAARPAGRGRGVGAVVLILVALLVGVVLIVRPLRRRLGSLAAAARRFGRGELTARADVGAGDAVDDLGAAFNRMADEIQRLIAAQQDLLRSVSHELRTPLQRLHFALESARDAPAASDRAAALARIDADLDALEALIDELLTYARLTGTAPATTAVDARRLVAEVCGEFGELAGAVTLVASPGGGDAAPLLVDADARLLRRAVGNLVGNALKHARTRVAVAARRVDDAVCVDVEDDGAGVPEAAREAIFEPFVRLDDAPPGARGYGLGLSIARRIAEHHGGRVSVATSDALGGARFRLALPRGGRGDAPEPPRAAR